VKWGKINASPVPMTNCIDRKDLSSAGLRIRVLIVRGERGMHLLSDQQRLLLRCCAGARRGRPWALEGMGWQPENPTTLMGFQSVLENAVVHA